MSDASTGERDRYDESHNLKYGVVQDEVETGYTVDESRVTITEHNDRYWLSMASLAASDVTIMFHELAYDDGVLWFKQHVGDTPVTVGDIDWSILEPRYGYGIVGEWFRDRLELDEYRTGAKCPECGSEILNDHMYSACENLDCDVSFEGVPDDSWEPYNPENDELEATNQ